MSYFRTLTVFYKELPKSIRYTTCIYIGTLLSYNAICTYFDSKDKLLDYKNDNLDNYQKQVIKNEWDAVKYGASEYSWNRLFNSILWPVSIITDIIN